MNWGGRLPGMFQPQAARANLVGIITRDYTLAVTWLRPGISVSSGLRILFLHYLRAGVQGVKGSDHMARLAGVLLANVLK